MFAQLEKPKENKNRTVANVVAQKTGKGIQGFWFVDNRPEGIAQRKLQEITNNSPQVKQAVQLQTITNNYSVQQYQTIQKKNKLSRVNKNKGPSQSSLSSASVVQLNFNKYGLNTDDQLDEYTNSLYENMTGAENKPKMIKLSIMMLSINDRLKSLGFPELEIVANEGLANSNSAHFDFATWKMEIDKNLLEINAALANTLYHEARHSEQWFKMIVLELVNGKSIDQVVSQMGVPKNIVGYAKTIDPNKILPKEQLPSVKTFYESVYGSGKEHRVNVLTNLKSGDNYTKYKNLPEEVDAWEVGGKVNETIINKVKILEEKIIQSKSLDNIRHRFSRLMFYSSMIGVNSQKVKNVLKKKLKIWEDQITMLRTKNMDKSGKNLKKYLKIVEEYNKLSGMAGVEKLDVINPEKVMGDFKVMDENLEKAQEKLEQHPNNWVVKKLVQYIKSCMSQYNSEIIRPEPNSANWAVNATGKFLLDIDQGILEAEEEGYNL